MITEYLSEIPPQILEKILVDNHLDDFYENMKKHLLEDKPHLITIMRTHTLSTL